MATKRHIADLWATRKIAERPGLIGIIFGLARKKLVVKWFPLTTIPVMICPP